MYLIKRKCINYFSDLEIMMYQKLYVDNSHFRNRQELKMGVEIIFLAILCAKIHKMQKDTYIIIL